MPAKKDAIFFQDAFHIKLIVVGNKYIMKNNPKKEISLVKIDIIHHKYCKKG